MENHQQEEEELPTVYTQPPDEVVWCMWLITGVVWSAIWCLALLVFGAPSWAN